MTTTRSEPDLVAIMAQSHRDVEKVFTETENGFGSPEYRKGLADHLTVELIRHAVLEERFVHPAIREYVVDGEKLVARALRENAKIETTLKQLICLAPSEGRFEYVLSGLTRQVRRLFKSEEADLLPTLCAACSARESAALAEKVKQAKEKLPEIPHPAAPGCSHSTLFFAPVKATIDEIRGILSK
jgi:hypothetical protein